MVLPVGAATNYVSTTGSDVTGNGTDGNPWASIDHADSQGLLSPGDVVIVQPGTYTLANAKGVVLAVSAGTATSNITYQTNGHVVINQTHGTGSYGFKVSVPGITLNGFEISGAQHGIYITGSANSKVNAGVIHDANQGGNAEGIFVNQSSNVTLTRNVIYNMHATAEAPWSPVGCGIRVSNSDNLKV